MNQMFWSALYWKNIHLLLISIYLTGWEDTYVVWISTYQCTCHPTCRRHLHSPCHIGMLVLQASEGRLCMCQKHHMYVPSLDMDMDLKLMDTTQRVFFAHKEIQYKENIRRTILSQSIWGSPPSLPGPPSPHAQKMLSFRFLTFHWLLSSGGRGGDGKRGQKILYKRNINPDYPDSLTYNYLCSIFHFRLCFLDKRIFPLCI